MFVWFVRHGMHVRIEVTESVRQNYELRFIDADGTERVETFCDTAALAERQEQLQCVLRAEGWTGPHGWVI